MPMSSPAAGPRRKLLLAPIPVSPTKPLTPSHVKALLWLDVLYKGTARLHDVTYANNRTTYDIAVQTLGFWIYLDELYPGLDWSVRDDVWVGERYVEYHRSGRTPRAEELLAYRQRVEQHGFIHPASRRLLDLWEEQYRLLGLHDPGLKVAKPLELDTEEVLERLAERELLLDLRGMGGPVYLDLTGDGLPLRQLIDVHGTDNYLLCALRELLPLARHHDAVAILCDEDLGHDALLLERTLRHFGHAAERMMVGRVPLDGSRASSRHGGWQEYTLDKLSARLLPGHSADAFRLGMRLYFIATLGWSSRESFRMDLLEQRMRWAEELLAQGGSSAEPVDEAEVLSGLARPSGYVDPYRLISLLTSKKRGPAMSAWVASVLL